jgi:hypothetical protein
MLESCLELRRAKTAFVAVLLGCFFCCACSSRGSSQSAAKPAREIAPMEEKRFVAQIPINYETVDYPGSMSLRSPRGVAYVEGVPERPGDSFLNTCEGEPFNKRLLIQSTEAFTGVMESHVGVGVEGELRFMNTYSFQGTTIIVPDTKDARRLCWRRVQDGWAYVCGLGTLKRVSNGKEESHDLGKNRTVDSCLGLLQSQDSILREGAARELGWLVDNQNSERVLPRLLPLLQDSSVYVRRGSAEAFGLIGTAESLAALRDALGAEKDELTVKYFKEAIALVAGDTLLNPTPKLGIEKEEPAASYISGKSAWTDMVLAARVIKRAQNGNRLLDACLTSPNKDIRKAVAGIKEKYDLSIAK